MADNIQYTSADDHRPLDQRVRTLKQRVALLNMHITEEAGIVAFHEGIQNNELPATYREKLERRATLLDELATLESELKSLDA